MRLPTDIHGFLTAFGRIFGVHFSVNDGTVCSDVLPRTVGRTLDDECRLNLKPSYFRVLRTHLYKIALFFVI